VKTGSSQVITLGHKILSIQMVFNAWNKPLEYVAEATHITLTSIRTTKKTMGADSLHTPRNDDNDESSSHRNINMAID
jgi:hypothetical protein